VTSRRRRRKGTRKEQKKIDSSKKKQKLRSHIFYDYALFSITRFLLISSFAITHFN